ncbi:hypothetical protein [Hoyosella altamirensis]|uniref:Terminase n=1 Tax=Hoyosella altamirensis TaxID=616997 RepID=A0A839RWE2_9ACTN|nr:hypothetical protein [Hoyosella altamirensis]MBB3040163.1 hypothetical protein [Hoyosella altamirensis]
MTPNQLQQHITELTTGLTPEQTTALLAHLEPELARHQALRNYPTAGALACALDPTMRQTPALKKVDEALEWAYTTPDARLMISQPSQTGKSKRAAIYGTLRAFTLNPDRRVIAVTHSEDLARTHSEEIRALIQTFGTGAKDAMTGQPLPDRLGLSLGAKNSSTRWTLAGHRGGLIAAGVGTALPGRPADLMILDDLYAGMEAADSTAIRRHVETWWDSVGSQRLSPGAPVICIGTRWNEKDIFAYLMAQEPDRWRVLNFPAIAQPGVLDSLGRKPGEPLANPAGDKDWFYLRSIKPARIWSATYQGNPTPVQGGLIKTEWFNNHRHTDTIPAAALSVVAVDPAETGKGDEAGIIAASIDRHRTVYLTGDYSGHFTSAEWAKTACQAARDTGASAIRVEAYTAETTYTRLLKQTWRDMFGQARCPRILGWRGKGDAIARSTGLREALETGRCVIAGDLEGFESQAVTWQQGQHQPDRVAAAIIAYDHLVTSAGHSGGAAIPTGSLTRGTRRGGVWDRRVG